MAQADPQIRAGVHYPAKDKAGIGNGPVDQVANGVVQVVAGIAVAHQGTTALLMHQHNRAHLLGGFPQGHKLRVIVGFAVDMVVNHRPDETHPADAALQLGHGQLDILHRDDRHALKAVGIVHGHLIDLVVALPVHGGDDLGVPLVVVVKAESGDDVDIHAQGVHIVDALFRRPGVAGADPHFPRLDPVPLPARPHSANETLGGQVRVNIDAPQFFTSG